MDGKLIFILLLNGIGLLEVILGVPLFLEKIPPNGLYGFRTEKTLSNPEIWYKVNKYSARDLIIGGLATVAVSIGLLIFRNKLEDYLCFAVFLVIVNLCPAIAIIRGLMYLKKI
ncbi:MAG: SdpI family protein [Phycisphaerae bacterium]